MLRPVRFDDEPMPTPRPTPLRGAPFSRKGRRGRLGCVVGGGEAPRMSKSATITDEMMEPVAPGQIQLEEFILNLKKSDELRVQRAKMGDPLAMITPRAA